MLKIGEVLVMIGGGSFFLCWPVCWWGLGAVSEEG